MLDVKGAELLLIGARGADNDVAGALGGMGVVGSCLVFGRMTAPSKQRTSLRPSIGARREALLQQAPRLLCGPLCPLALAATIPEMRPPPPSTTQGHLGEAGEELLQMHHSDSDDDAVRGG